MGKRSSFERNPRDYYPTPESAVLPLLPYVSGDFIEPCAGDGRLIRKLEKHGLRCTYACDIEPQNAGIEKQDALSFGFQLPQTPLIITNPPWKRNRDGTGPLHEMINRFRQHAATWLLFDAGWMFTSQAVPFLRYCSRIVPVGRVSWMDNGKNGMDDCCWYEFGTKQTRPVFMV